MDQTNDMQQIVKVKISSLHINTGQIEGVPRNARFIKDDKFQLLIRSIEEDPEFMELKPLYVYRSVVIGGNMRLRACRQLKWKEVPVINIPDGFPPEKLRALAIKDNTHYGEHDWDVLANEWSDSPLREWGVFKEYVPFSPNYEPQSSQSEITDDDIIESQDKLDNQFTDSDPLIFNIICPSCGHEFKVKSPR